VRELAAEDGIDLAASTAYSDSHTDLPFLEAVGHPVAVNPDRALRRVARDRRWPVLEFTARHVPHARRRVHPVLAGVPFLLGVALASRRRAA
jgi:phosphoserine phosphatase